VIREEDSDVSFEIELNETSTCLTIHCFSPKAFTIEEFAAALQDLIEELRNGEESVTQLLAKDH
jgi:hypothetical protein